MIVNKRQRESNHKQPGRFHFTNFLRIVVSGASSGSRGCPNPPDAQNSRDHVISFFPVLRAYVDIMRSVLPSEGSNTFVQIIIVVTTQRTLVNVQADAPHHCATFWLEISRKYRFLTSGESGLSL